MSAGCAPPSLTASSFSLARTRPLSFLPLLSHLHASGMAPAPTLAALLYALSLTGFFPGLCSTWSSSERGSNWPNEPFVAPSSSFPSPPPPDDPDSAYYELDPDTTSRHLDSESPNGEIETSLEENRFLVTTPELTSAYTRVTEEEQKKQNLKLSKTPSEGSDAELGREKRSSETDWHRSSKAIGSGGSSPGGRVQTGATILNIRGAVRDAIGDAGAAPGPRASSRLDTFVIRPAAAAAPPAPAPVAASADQQQEGDEKRGEVREVREVLVAMHARARLPCDLGNVTRLRWYKDNDLVRLDTAEGGSEGVWGEGEGGGRVVVVGRATRAHAGRWRCAGAAPDGTPASGKPTTLLVYEAVRAVYLAVDGRRLDAGNTWVPVRDRAPLEVRCVAEGGVPAPALTWRLAAAEPALDARSYLRPRPANRSLEGVWWSSAVVTAARELHNATLQCVAAQRTPPPAAAPLTLTAQLQIHVTYPPSFVISRWPGFGVALVAGAPAALRCDVDANPPARAHWLRDDKHTTSSPAPEEGGGGGGGGGEGARGAATLRWARLLPAHAGWYRCRASWMHHEYSSIGYYLNVIEPGDEGEEGERGEESAVKEEEGAELQEELDHQKVEVPVGGSVQLHCPKGSVGCWWRRVVGNGSAGWAPAGSHRAHGVLGITEALYQEGGEYRCVGARGADLKRLQHLKRVTLKVTGGATATAVSAAREGAGWRLECGVCGRGARVVWLRGGGGGGEPGGAEPARLVPDLPQHCWRAHLHVHHEDEMWCVAWAPGGGAVAVFPPRAAPAPARHTVRAPPNRADGARSLCLASLLALCSLALARTLELRD